MILNCSFVNEKFEFVEEGNIEIRGGRIKEVCEGYSVGENFRDFAVIPSLINAHTHIGDSFAKEACLNLTASDAVGKRGLKWKLYADEEKGNIISAVRNSAVYMLYSGITVFSDFREFGILGVRELRDALSGLEIKPVILGRDIKTEDLDEVDGLGLNVYNLRDLDEVLDKNLRIKIKNRNKIFSVHAGEGKGEINEALKYDPDFIVHFLNPSDEEIESAKKNKISVIVCPRSNLTLKTGFPDVKKLCDSKINVSLGTDNVMLNSPNLWREMEFLSKASCEFIEPEEILKCATINPSEAFRLNCGIIKKGRDADLIFIDRNALNLKYNKNFISALVNRCEPENVRKVMVKGKFVVVK